MVGLLRRYSNFGDEVKRLESLVDLPGERGAEAVAVPRLRVQLSDQDEQKLVLRYGQGANIRQLATEFGINREKVSLVLQRQGVETRYHQMVEVDLDQAAQLQAEGLNITEVAAAMGIGRTTLVRARRAKRRPADDSRP